MQTKAGILSLRNKILMLTAMISLASAIVMGIYFFDKITKQALTSETEKLSIETSLLAPFFTNAFETLRNDIKLLHNTPPIQGIVRSTKNNGIDPLDNSTTELWEKRLATIFEAMLKSKPNYIQIRYIGLANNAKELVRVNRNGHNIEIVQQDNLQEKGNEPYIFNNLDASPNTVRFSSINLNRENGVVQIPRTPVIRSILPVYDDKTLFGFLVINTLYEGILADIIKDINVNNDLYIINEEGDYLTYKAGDYHWDVAIHDKAQEPSHPLLREILNDTKKQGQSTIKFGDQETLIHHTKISYDESNPKRFIAIALTTPVNTIVQAAQAHQSTALLIILGLTLGSLVIATLFSLYLTTPLNTIINEIRRYGEGDTHLKLPTNHKDEIGELSKAFEELIQNLETSQSTERDLTGRIKSIFDNTFDGIITLDENGNIEQYNKACEKIFGHNLEDMYGQNIRALLSIKETTDAPIPFEINKPIELIGQHKNKAEFPIEISIREIELDDKKIYSGTIRDITEQKQAEAEILRSNEQLAKFAYLASHDLQEPLRMITNFSTLLEKEIESDLSENGHKYLEFISSSAKRMQTMVTDLLEYSRIGDEATSYEKTDMNTQLEIALTNLQASINESEAKITHDRLPVLMSSPVRITSLLQNLIGNAIKYRSKERKPNIHIGYDDQGDHWRFSVKDNGIGMEHEHLEQIFSIFKRLHGKYEYSGTGIGLSICQRIIENMNGRIWAESTIGEGSTFYFTLPKE